MVIYVEMEVKHYLISQCTNIIHEISEMCNNVLQYYGNLLSRKTLMKNALSKKREKIPIWQLKEIVL